MSISTARQRLLTDAYSLVRRSGLLETSLGRRAFQSAYFLYKRCIEDDLAPLLRRHPSFLEGGDILDIGANIGYTATVLARAAEPGRTVYAFEPEPFNYEILQRVAGDTPAGRKIAAVQCAVGAENGSVDLWFNDRHHADHRVMTDAFRTAHTGSRGMSVPLVTIDDFLARHPGEVSFVKIDVQGYELAVCQGMARTLESNRNLTIVLEYMPSALRDLGFEPSQLLDFLFDRGFQAHCVHPAGRLSQGIPTDLDDSSYADLLFSRCPIDGGGAA